MTRFLLALIAFYRRWISPALHAVSSSRCKFIPTCSEYAEVAIATHGPLRGAGLAAWRLVRCHPFTPGGYDPVPIRRPVALVSMACGKTASEEHEVSGHDFSRAESAAKSSWALAPVRVPPRTKTLSGSLPRPALEPACVGADGTVRLEAEDSSASKVPSPREPLP
jgi:uncharacterized protein